VREIPCYEEHETLKLLISVLNEVDIVFEMTTPLKKKQSSSANLFQIEKQLHQRHLRRLFTKLACTVADVRSTMNLPYITSSAIGIWDTQYTPGHRPGFSYCSSSERQCPRCCGNLGLMCSWG
jgi:hypothetical protein